MRTRPICPAEPLSPLAELSRAVDAALASVLATEFQADPILGGISELVSKASSLQKRHGLLLELAVVSALRASGRFEVLTGVDVPITAAADSIVASTAPETLDRIALRYDAPTVRVVNLDFIVVDAERGWAGGFDCKRGGGQLTRRLLRPLVRDLECAGVLLRSFLRDRGHPTIDRITVGLLDIYGASRAPDHLVLNLADLDGFFGVPVASVINAMNDKVAGGFARAVPDLLAPILGSMRIQAAEEDALAKASSATAASTQVRTPARFTGPTAIRH